MRIAAPLILDTPLPSSTDGGSKLKSAATQFESLLIQEMLKASRSGSEGGWLGSGDEAGEDSAMDMAQAQFSEALAKQGGIGLAKMVVDKMQPVAGQKNAATDPLSSPE